MTTFKKWCCVAFENHYDEAGERSIAVLVDRDEGGAPEFLLQSRAFSIQNAPPLLNIPAPMSRVIEDVITFCPWCGVDLAKWYGKQANELVRSGLRIDRAC